MSDTPKPAPQREDGTTNQEDVQHAIQSRAVRLPRHAVDGAMGFGIASVWISLVLGLILLMLGANFGRWTMGKLSGKPFQTGVEWSAAAGEKAGQMVDYFDLQGGTAWSDAGLFFMGVALLLDAALMFIYFHSGRPSSAVIWCAMLFVGIAMAINLYVAVRLFSMNIMPLLSMGTLLVGGMMLFDHLPMARRR